MFLRAEKRPPASRWPLSLKLKDLSNISINNKPVFVSEVVINKKAPIQGGGRSRANPPA
jgi:hypothetical protein